MNDDRYDTILRRLIADKWEVVSEGPSGDQLRGVKKMTSTGKGAMLVGTVLVFAYGIGIIVIAFALIDHAMQKAPTHFLQRSNPVFPAGMGR